MSTPNGDQPEGHFFDPALQHERTSLAWERTAIAMMVSGILLARYAASDAYPALAAIGLAQTMAGGFVMVWAGRRYDELHAPLHAGEDISHATAVRWLGLSTVAFAAAALLLALLLVAL